MLRLRRRHLHHHVLLRTDDHAPIAGELVVERQVAGVDQQALFLERQQLLLAGKDGDPVASGAADDGRREFLVAAPEYVALPADHADDDLQPAVAGVVEDGALVGVARHQLSAAHEVGAEHRACQVQGREDALGGTAGPMA